MRLRLADQRGIALVMSLGVLIVLSITTVSLISYTSSGVRSVRYGHSRQTSVLIAEAGLNEAVSVLSQVAATGGDVRDPAALPAGSDTFDGGSSAAWTGTVNGDTWTVSSTSTVKNPTGAGVIHRTASTQFRIGVDGEGSAPAWQFTYAEGAQCTDLSNTAQISVPFYIKGDLCLKNSANPIASDITVTGHISLENSSKIGSSTTPIENLHTSGCGDKNGPYTLANCDAAHKVYANHVDSVFENVSKPAADFPYWYAYSKPGPRNNCTTGSFSGGFDNNTTLDRSRSEVHMLGNSAYSCTFTSGSSTIGKLIWTPGSPGTLQISGVIFFDGNMKFDNTDQAVYVGRATIYASGKIEFKNSSYMCGYAACDTNAWDGDANMVTFVAGGCEEYNSGGGTCKKWYADSFIAADSSKIQGGVWSYTDTRQKNSALIEGPTISRQLQLDNSAVALKWPSIDFVSYGAPAPIGSTKLVPITGTYTD